MISRIAIIGISGSGKSTLARVVSSRLNLPTFHADAFEWLPCWTEQAPDIAVAANRRITNLEHWVFEGWVDESKADRLDAADLVIDLDYPGVLCAWRLVRRMMAKQRRPELPDGCIDDWDWSFLWTVLSRAERPNIDQALRSATLRRYERFRSPKQLDRWLVTL